MKKIIFEILSLIESWYIRKQTKELSPSDLIFIGREGATNIFCMCGVILPTGGSGTALRLASEIMKLDRSYAVALQKKGIVNFESIFRLFEGCDVRVFESKAYDENFNKLIFTNWQSYYKFKSFVSVKKYMFVQDGEFWFFPRGGIYFYASAPYLDESVTKICLGDWLARFPEISGATRLHVPFPTTLSPVGSSPRVSKNLNKITILVYVKHSFRRAGGVLLEQLRLASRDLNGRQIEYRVFGYSPTLIFSLRYPKNVKFLGYIPEHKIMKEIQGCDIGVVYSCTNVSLFPFQLASFGKPMIELKGGGAEITQLRGSIIYISCDYQSLQSGIKKYIANKTFYDNAASNSAVHACSMQITAAAFAKILSNDNSDNTLKI